MCSPTPLLLWWGALCFFPDMDQPWRGLQNRKCMVKGQEAMAREAGVLVGYVWWKEAGRVW